MSASSLFRPFTHLGPTLFIGVLLASISCDATRPATVKPGRVGSITVSPDSVDLHAGTTQQLVAEVRDVNGNLITDRLVSWSADEGKGTVSPAGVVTQTIANGSFTVTATVDGKSATAKIVAVTFFRLIAGYDHTCAATQAGETFCWGNNSFGALGDNSTTSTDTPRRVRSSLLFTALAAGNGFSCGIASNANASCWGANDKGQLGTGSVSTSPSLTPLSVAGDHTWIAISAGQYSACGLVAGGQAYCWGDNSFGQLGTGDFAQRSQPTLVKGGLSFSSIGTSGRHTCGLTAAGAAYCWGNASGIGDGTSLNKTTPVAVVGGLTFTSLRVGGNHSCGLAASGVAYCWGGNYVGQLGTPVEPGRLTPAPVATALRFTILGTGYNHTCGIISDGSAFCWGDYRYGQLGNGVASVNFEGTSIPQEVVGGFAFTGIRGGASHTCGLVAETGAAACWGSNRSGELGNGMMINQLSIEARPSLVRGHSVSP